MSGTISNAEELVCKPRVPLLPRTIHFCLLQSLQDIALTRIAVAICTNSEMASFRKDIRGEQLDNHLFHSYHDDCSRKNLKRVEEKSKEIISRLPLTQAFKAKVLSYVVPMTVEIETWMNDHSDIIFPAFDVQNYFCWKSEGIIDREKTIDVLLNLKDLPFFYRYDRFRLACLYCKEHDAKYLWSMMSDDEKDSFNSKSYDHSSILGYWHAQFNRKRKDLRLNNYIGIKKFCLNTFVTNVSALRYLWDIFRQKYCLYHKEEGEFLLSHLKRSYMYPEIVRFYLDELDDEYHYHLLIWQATDIGKSFLNWPYQTMFLDVKEFYFRPEALLNHILREKIVPKCEDYNYLELLKKFWEQIPASYRAMLKDRSVQYYLQAVLFAIAQDNTESLTKEWLDQMDIEMKRQFENYVREREAGL
ncbi:hypothetical protein AVEN_112667-1 [Araneus ventricosus]|uniref:Uncharacterized protein n=1 Tax=Araneus ventricosus TaxID=182803 RepID=A0A4Y2KUC8_ARAVE|nr:hypothetical protein AVEN_112667-1 [Araneus ventricosus]